MSVMQSSLLSVTAAVALAHTVGASLLGDFSGHALLLPRQENTEEAYIASVCTPNSTDPVPPCQAIINIEAQCQPNGTAAIDFLAHQQCMCNGGYFSNWDGCLNCQYVHGARSEAEAEAFSSIISSASVSLCTGTPTQSFAAIFAEITNTAPQVASGAATTTSDQYPSDAAVSLYYTATGAQGAGAITGSATQATAQVSSTASSTGSSARSSSGTTGSTSARSSGSSSAATTTKASSTSGTASAATTSASQTGAANGLKAVGPVAIVVAVGSFFGL